MTEEADAILARIAGGRTDEFVRLLARDDWRDLLGRGAIVPLRWAVYYGDVTAMRAVLAAGGDLSSIDLDEELGNAAFFHHWKMVDFLLAQGADPTSRVPGTGETPLHSALAKAGRPAVIFVVRRLLEAGADPNAATLPGQETGAFMRDVRTRGETPLHRAAAYADADTIRMMIQRGADVEARDAHGASPLTWASEHLRPGRVLALLQYGEHRISPRHELRNTSDHGAGWGHGMEWSLVGDYLPEEPTDEP